jgi:Xaa-Pro aminopeptidase
MDYLRRGSLSQAEIVDSTDLLDRIKAIKSDEELRLIRGVAAQQDEAMGIAFAAVKPGMEEKQVAELANHHMRSRGSMQGILMTGSGPVGTPSGITMPFMQGRRVEAGDQFHFLLEVNGREGFFTELGRFGMMARIPQEIQEQFDLLLEARQVSLERMRPGASPRDIWEAHNSFFRARGLKEETRLYSHSQGYDLVERPLIRSDEDMLLEENMVFAVHPMLATPTSFTWICDNFLVRRDGPPERLHRFPEKVIEIH